MPGCVRKQFFQPDARPAASQPLAPAADSVRGVTAGRQYARHGRLYNALVGQHHRRTWAAPVNAPVFRLAEARPGGLRPGKVGGGFNSTSLNLQAADGRSYVLRTVDKDPIRATPPVLRGTFLVNTLRDNISSTNPYSALVVPLLATAVGVPHTSPQLFYVRPDDPAFEGDSLRLFRGQLAYLEEKTAVLATKSSESPVSSTDAFRAVFAHSGDQIDQDALLRARLMDAWLGDWDRHPGQWNWAVLQPGRRLFSPLPKDRDMVFYRLDDGVLGWLIGHLALRHWTTFDSRYPNLTDLLSNGHYLDVRGLNGLPRAKFEAVARAMQEQLSDAVIDQAVHRLPRSAFALEGPRLIAALEARRAALPELAAAFYEHLARRPVVGGTAQAEHFVVRRTPNHTLVEIYNESNGRGQELFKRTFLPAETRIIQLEGLGGDDVFEVVNGSTKNVKSPRINIYGGTGTDRLLLPKKGGKVRFHQGSNRAGRAYDKLPEE